ncbi:B12-binding domain-containing radical SAM protein [Paenisporosarcina cavernae]|uniref:DUF4080 domain-containing protein n=1 Tax=Paenisporosarcina cavernae TaxID=2320858 RepID=A0A385YQT1_9BACL|nr:B12-binding domain-containing radical SAM protein [Paenisporosarcina cavernae]AYC29059.1 DUF4080 domain-containing protein [Paenisporosarcina cavernae]
MKILLTTLNAKYIHTNLALRCLKVGVTPHYNPQIIEYTIKDPSMNIVSDIYQRKPDIVGFSCYIWNIEETLKVAEMLKEVLPNTTIILGGPEVSYDTHYWLKSNPFIDFVLMGEGELSFLQFLHYMHGKLPIEQVNGLAYLVDGKCKIHPQGPKLDLRTAPSPHRLEEDVAELSKRIVYIETSRGCPFSCQFCLSSIEVGVRYFNRETVKSDIRYLMKNGAKTIKFVDRTFNISRSYAMEMFQFLIDEHLPGVVFQFEITADIMRPEVIQFLNDNAPKGLFRFEIGVQSTNDLTNELVKRRQNFDKLTRTVTMVRDGGKIDQHLDLIAGLPEEDYASFRETFNDVFALRPEELQLGFLKLLRGTGLRMQADQYGYTYVDRAPYEIFSSNVLSFDDMLRIKQAEDVLEKYWNAHRLDQTVTYLIEHVFDTPFDFFQQFGTYWESRGWSRIGHQLEDLFTRLDGFLQTLNGVNLDIVHSLMKLDYLTHHKFQPRKPWWPKDVSDENTAYVYELLKNHEISSAISERDLHKRTLLTNFSLDLNELQHGNYKPASSTLVAYFSGNDQPQLMTF